MRLVGFGWRNAREHKKVSDSMCPVLNSSAVNASMTKLAGVPPRFPARIMREFWLEHETFSPFRGGPPSLCVPVSAT